MNNKKIYSNIISVTKKLINYFQSLLKKHKIPLEIIPNEEFFFKNNSFKNSFTNIPIETHKHIYFLSKKYNINSKILYCIIATIKKENNKLTNFKFPSINEELEYIAKTLIRNFRRFEIGCHLSARDVIEPIYPINAASFALYMQIPFAGISDFYNIEIIRDENNIAIDKKINLLYKKPHGISIFIKYWNEIEGDINESTFSCLH